MSESNKKEPITSMRVPKSIDDYVSAVATRERIPKATVLQRIIDKVIEKDSNDPMDKLFGLLDKGGGEEMSGLKEMLMLKILAGTPQPAPQQNPLMEVLMMKTLTAPDPLILLMAQNKGDGGNERMLQMLIEQQKETQQVIRDTLMQRDIDQNRAATAAMIEQSQASVEQLANGLAQRLSIIENMVSSVPAGERPQLSDEIKNYLAIGDALKEFASKAGMGKEEVVRQDGSIDWNNIIGRFFNMADGFIEKLPNERPAKAPVREVDTGSLPPQPDMKVVQNLKQVTQANEAVPSTDTEPAPTEDEMKNFEDRVKAALHDINKDELAQEGAKGGDK
jgi:hypothetical protein